MFQCLGALVRRPDELMQIYRPQNCKKTRVYMFCRPNFDCAWGSATCHGDIYAYRFAMPKFIPDKLSEIAPQRVNRNGAESAFEVTI